MIRFIVHIGLAVVVALAPALCCCQYHESGAVAHAKPLPNAISDSQPVDACCIHTTKHSCCQEFKEPDQESPAPQNAPSRCACCAERQIAAQTETKPRVAASEPTGELISLARLVSTADPLARSSLIRGLEPWHHAGSDAQYESLFLRHTLRC